MSATTNVFDMSPAERETAVSQCREQSLRDTIRFFRRCHETGMRVYKGCKVSPSCSIYKLRLAQSKRANEGRSWVVDADTGEPVGDSDNWAECYANAAELRLEPI